MNKILFLLSKALLLIYFIFISNASLATHSAGAEITYRWISDSANTSTYEITGTFYRDCAGVAAPTTLPITVSSLSCNRTINQFLSPVAGTGQEIVYPCGTPVTTCTNSSSTTPGFQKHVYRGNITLPVRCADWVFSYQVCCRNCAITTMTQPPNCNASNVTTNVYVEATLNNLNFSNNNSPTFNDVPVSFICLGQNFNYSFGGNEIDGDSLYYELVNARADANTSIPYINPYSGTNPLNSSPAITINHATGDISLNAQLQQVGVLAARIREYRNGILIGSVIRDMQFIVESCSTNHLPTVSGINGSVLSDTSICAGSTVSFTVNANDADPGQTLTMTWDNGIPGATFTTSGSPHPTGTFTWNTTAADERVLPYFFTVTVSDNYCPTIGVQSRTFRIDFNYVHFNLSSSGSNVICSGDSVLLQASNIAALTYQWQSSSDSGITWIPIPGAIADSCYANNSGSYSCVVSTSNCVSMSSNPIYVTVNNSLPVAIIAASGVTQFCPGDSVTLNANTGAGLSYQWFSMIGGAIFDAASSSYTATVSGDYFCVVTNGCGDDTSNLISVIVNPSVIASAGPDTTICSGASTILNASGGVTYLWSTSDTVSSISVSPAVTTDYLVTVTNSDGCSASDIVSINVLASPQAIYTIYADTVNLHNWITDNHSTGATTLFYMWSWGDGSANSFGIAPSHTYSVPGNYEICLTATDSLGCSDTYCDSSTYLNRGTEVTTIVTVNAIIVPTVVRSPDDDINSITVYPNPAVNSVVIEARRETPFEKIIIYSIEGRKVQEEILHTKSSKVEINVSILSKGVYFLNCIFEKTSRMVIMTKE